MHRPGFSLCICPDSRLLRDGLDALLASHSPQGNGGRGATSSTPGEGSAPSWQRVNFWADEGLPNAFWEHLTLQGLFAMPKAIILRNAHTLPADTLKRLSAVLISTASQGGSGLIWPLLCFEVLFEKGKAKVPVHIARLPFWQTAEQKGWIEEIPGLTGHDVSAYIRSAAARHGISPSPQELRRLSLALPPDAAFIHSELTKLALLADKNGRLPDNALDMTEHSRELSIFELMNIIQQNGDSPAAWRRILEYRLSGDNMVFACIAVLLREARSLWQILAGAQTYLPPQVAARKKTAARQLGFAGIARLWDIALMADKGIKTGERSTDQAFEMLAADLFRLFGRRRGM
ncbi:MAG: DNA polymerase III subunit delta [Desulfovibrio sp.]|jgi:DNA polymerase-3 subunit delta|nr:DNA polymerase III subunit delta [Desulfovibrio sp.]